MKTDRNSAMYEYWSQRRGVREGLGPAPAEIAAACAVSIHACTGGGTALPARSCPVRHRSIGRSRTPSRGITSSRTPPNTRACPGSSGRERTRPKPWPVDELTAWLRLALSDRFAAMWLLGATTGMCRSEPAGVDRDGLDLDAVTLVIDDTASSLPATRSTRTARRPAASARSPSTRSPSTPCGATSPCSTTSGRAFGPEYDTSHTQAHAVRGRAAAARGHDHAALQPARRPRGRPADPAPRHPTHLRHPVARQRRAAKIVSDGIGHTATW